MRKCFLLLILFPITLCSQQLPSDSKRWLDESLNANYVDLKELLADFIKYNFCSVWKTKQESTLGFIDENYQRFYIHFQDITKNDSTPSLYTVKGKTRVDNNICNFNGEIKILNIREINKHEREKLLTLAKKDNDIDRMKRHQYKTLMILAKYTFREDKNQKGSGILKGIMKSYFYINDNAITYDDIDFKYSDSYSNNLCVGTWKSYKTGAEKKCNWGNYRIPYSGDLDIGAGEFSPNDKYLKYGWESYRKSYFEKNQDALKEEEKQWWLR
jgi:hypothetical protein